MTTTHASFKLGKNAPALDPRTLTFDTYVSTSLVAAPAAVDNYSAVSSWPMYNNDKWGDCTCAAAAHMVQSWTASAGDPVTPEESAVDVMYEHFVGNPPPEDAGCNMLDVLRYWRKTGMGGDHITAFVGLGLGNHDALRAATFLFGSVYIGVALPNFAVTGDMLATVWDVPAGGAVGDAAPNPKNGHCIPAVGYDADNVYVVTWGELKTMSWSFYDAYADEAFAVLSTDFIAHATDDTAAGFNLSQLRADLAAIKSS